MRFTFPGLMVLATVLWIPGGKQLQAQVQPATADGQPQTEAEVEIRERIQTIRVLVDGMPPSHEAFAHRLVTRIGAAGLPVATLSCAELAEGSMLTVARTDAVVLPYSPAFPAAGFDPLMAYLRDGGDLVLLGGRAFSQPLLQTEGIWQTPAQFASQLAQPSTDRMVLFDFQTSQVADWRRGASNSDAPSHSTIGSSGADEAERALRLDLRDVTWYDVISTEIDTRIPAGHNALYLRVKADPATPQVFVELTEDDGSRWSRAIDVSPEWAYYVLPAATFLFKADGSPADRGGEGDRLHLSQSARIALGLAKERTAAIGDRHTIHIDDIGTTVAPPGLAGADRGLPFRQAFDDYSVYRLQDVVRVRTYTGQDWLDAEFSLVDPVSGWSAIGFSTPHESTFVPLLAAEDVHGRVAGWATGVLIHHDGAYAGSQWGLFGVEDPAFYAKTETVDLVITLLRRFRSHAWVDRARQEASAMRRDRLALRSPPLPALRIQDGHFVYPDGRRFFMIGVNFWNSFDTYYGGGIQWDVRRLERDFERMQRAGINAIRIHGFRRFSLPEEPHRLETFIELCRRHGIYVLAGINLGKHTYLRDGKSAMQVEARRVARLLEDETAILGYDLQNEPYWWEIARAPFDETTLGEAFPVPEGAWGEYFRSLDVCEGNWTSTFPGLQGPLPVPEDHRLRQAYNHVNAVMGTWIGWLIEAVRQHDKEHPITVGYNTILECLPANLPLDFVSHHVYEPPESLAHVTRNLTTLDRLRRIWPDRPISLGEFGYSGGDVIDGTLLDMHTQAVGEIVHWLYALANGYDGAMKWQLCDADPAYQWRFATWRRDESDSKRLRQRRFGMFWPDGTPEGRAKPIACATRFLRECVDQGLQSGTLVLKDDPNLIGTSYEFRSPGVLFLGGSNPKTDDVRVTSAHSVNLMLRWNSDNLTMLATADANVVFDPTELIPGKDVTVAQVDPGCSVTRRDGGGLHIELLEGRRVRFAIDP